MQNDPFNQNRPAVPKKVLSKREIALAKVNLQLRKAVPLLMAELSALKNHCPNAKLNLKDKTLYCESSSHSLYKSLFPYLIKGMWTLDDILLISGYGALFTLLHPTLTPKAKKIATHLTKISDLLPPKSKLVINQCEHVLDLSNPLAFVADLTEHSGVYVKNNKHLSFEQFDMIFTASNTLSYPIETKFTKSATTLINGEHYHIHQRQRNGDTYQKFSLVSKTLSRFQSMAL
jgi:hypothetical protein